MQKIHIVGSDDFNKRVDVFLAEKHPEYSRSFFQRQIKTGNVLVDDKKINPAFRLNAGATVCLTLLEKLADVPEHPGRQLTAGLLEKLPEADGHHPARRLTAGLLDVLYEDEHIIVINKPAGMSVHPPGYARNISTGLVSSESYQDTDMRTLSESSRCSGMRSLSESYQDPDMRTLVEILGQGYFLVHRLDRDTSGVIIAAKTRQAQFSLSKQFKNREVRKTYLGIVHGIIKEKKGIIKSHLSRSPHGNRKIRVGFGRESITEFEVLRRLDSWTLVKIFPVTGRTHQIRVQFASIKHPIAGDKLYGQKNQEGDCPGGLKPTRQLLHAWKIQFVHPGSNKPQEWTAEPPSDILEVLKKLKCKNL